MAFPLLSASRTRTGDAPAGSRVDAARVAARLAPRFAARTVGGTVHDLTAPSGGR